MLNVLTPFRALVFAAALGTLGCRAQAPPVDKGQPLSPAIARRIEVLIRSKSNVPPDYTIAITDRRKSEIAGYDQVTVTFNADGQSSKPATFLISDDNKTLAQFSRYDISKDPKDLVSAANRPARGGPADAPVLIVVFDDLECPFCSKMHAEVFPALTNRYGKQVRVVYRDFPLDQHPWALRAAVDANCLAAQSSPGYWNVVDWIHAHASDFGGSDHLIAKANEQLDTLTKEEGKRQHVNGDTLNACVVKQDASAVEASRKDAATLGVDSTPALFINGERIEGAIPIEYVYRVIDSALTAEGQTPPPPVPVPPMATAGKPAS